MNDLARRIRDALEPRLRARGLVVQRPPAPEKRPRPDGESLARARRAYENLHPEKAAEHVDAWLTKADASGGAGIDRAQLLDALLLKSMAAHAQGNAGTADAAMDRALAVEPGLSLDAAQYPPTLRDRLKRRRKARASKEPTPVTIRPVAADATVAIDGKKVGTGNVRTTLLPGIHLVRVEAPGRRPVGRRVRVGTRSVTLQLPLTYEVARASEVAGDPGSAVPPELERAVATANANPLVLDVHEDGTGIVAVLRDPSTDRIIRARAGSTPPKPAALAGDLAAGLGVAPGRMVSRAGGSGSGDEGTTARIAWIAGGTAAGVAVAVAASVLGVFLSDDGGVTQWRATGRRVGD